LTKDDKIKLSLGIYVQSTSEIILARTHLMREWALKWVLAPLLYITVFTCLFLFVLDATGLIQPMRDGLLAVIKFVLCAGVIGQSLGLGFGWLFRGRSDPGDSD
jgi:hypothetical protein